MPTKRNPTATHKDEKVQDVSLPNRFRVRFLEDDLDGRCYITKGAEAPI